MNQLPISVCFFTSTRGHFSRKTDWKLTLDHLDKQIPLSSFGGLLASLKITPGEEEIAAAMEKELTGRGFKVLTATADWTRGTSHQIAYMSDVCRLARDPIVHSQPYIWWMEDDGVCLSHIYTLDRLLAASISLLADDANLVSVRLMRRCDNRGPTVESTARDPRFFYSHDVNLQPLLLRARDFQLLALGLERNWEAVKTVQCERLIRMILDSFTTSQFRHIVWEPDFAEVFHTGIPQSEHEQLCKALNL